MFRVLLIEHKISEFSENGRKFCVFQGFVEPVVPQSEYKMVLYSVFLSWAKSW